MVNKNGELGWLWIKHIKQKAMEEIEGATRDQYKHLRSYAAKILDKNKNNTVKLKCDLTPHGLVFERICICSLKPWILV